MNISGQYERFCHAARIGVCSETMFADVQEIYGDATKACAEKSMQDAIHNEIGQTLADFEYPEHFEGIDIITDARHATRENSAFSDVIALGGKTQSYFCTDNNKER